MRQKSHPFSVILVLVCLLNSTSLYAASNLIRVWIMQNEFSDDASDTNLQVQHIFYHHRLYFEDTDSTAPSDHVIMLKGHHGSSTINFSFYQQYQSFFDQKAFLKKFISYLESHPEDVIQIRVVTWSEAPDVIMKAYQDNILPDIFQLGTTWIESMEQLMNPISIKELNDFYHSRYNFTKHFHGELDRIVKNSEKSSDPMYKAIPLWVDVKAFYLRKTYFKNVDVSPLEDISELKDLMRFIKQNDALISKNMTEASLAAVATQGLSFALPILKREGGVRDYNILHFLSGYVFLKEGVGLEFRDNAKENLLTLIYFLKEHRTLNWSFSMPYELEQKFLDGEVASIFGNISLINNIERKGLEDDIGVYFPVLNPFLGGSVLAISYKTDKKKCLSLIEHLTMVPENNLNLSIETGFLPAVNKSIDMINSDLYRPFSKILQINHYLSYPSHRGWSEVEFKLVKYLSDLFHTTATLKTDIEIEDHIDITLKAMSESLNGLKPNVFSASSVYILIGALIFIFIAISIIYLWFFRYRPVHAQGLTDLWALLDLVRIVGKGYAEMIEETKKSVIPLQSSVKSLKRQAENAHHFFINKLKEDDLSIAEKEFNTVKTELRHLHKQSDKLLQARKDVKGSQSILESMKVSVESLLHDWQEIIVKYLYTYPSNIFLRKFLEDNQKDFNRSDRKELKTFAEGIVQSKSLNLDKVQADLEEKISHTVSFYTFDDPKSNVQDFIEQNNNYLSKEALYPFITNVNCYIYDIANQKNITLKNLSEEEKIQLILKNIHYIRVSVIYIKDNTLIDIRYNQENAKRFLIYLLYKQRDQEYLSPRNLSSEVTSFLTQIKMDEKSVSQYISQRVKRLRESIEKYIGTETSYCDLGIYKIHSYINFYMIKDI